MTILRALDRNENGAFARFVHATSSVNSDRIGRVGLQPLADPREEIAAYLRRLRPAPSEDEIGHVLLLDYPGIRNTGAGRLLAVRLEDVPCVSLLPLLGSGAFLNSARDNAMLDGGEIFRLARHVLEGIRGKSIDPAFPEANWIIVIARFFYERVQGGLFTIRNIDSFGCFPEPDLPKSIQIGNFEFRSRAVPNEDILIMTPREFYQTERILS